MKKTWLITGCSTGLGYSLAMEVLAAGDDAVITARKTSSLSDLAARYPERCKVVQLDVTQKAQIQTAVKATLEAFGRIDVLVNNAGYGVMGAVEEIPESEARRIFETNFFGLLEMTRQVIPVMRSQSSGQIFNLSSVGGLIAMPGLALYNATKFAIEGLSEAWAAELAPFGIQLTIVQPGPFRTHFVKNSSVVEGKRGDYNAVVAATCSYMAQIDGKQPGNPAMIAKAIINTSRMENPPLRLPLGKVTLARFRSRIEQWQEDLDTWEKVALETDYP